MSGNGGQSTSVKNKVSVPNEAKALAGNLLTTGEDVAPSADSLAFKPWEGPSTLGLRPQEEALRTQGIGNLLADRPGEDASKALLMRNVRGDNLDPNTNPALARQVAALGEDTNVNLGKGLNQQRDIYGRTGGGGGSREALALGQATGESNRGFGANVANMLASNYNTERGYQQSSIPQLQDLENQPFNRQMQAMGLEAIPRSIDQSNLTAAKSEFERGQQERFAPLNAAMAILGQRLGTSSTTTGTGSAGLFSK